MNYLISTKDNNIKVDFRTAVLKGISPDGGLFMPEEYPLLSQTLLNNMSNLSMSEIAFEVIKSFNFGIPETQLKNISDRVFTFDVPLVNLSNNLKILELFRGPTFAFKDFGARFLAELISCYLKEETKEVFVLVATSGDTGSAVANSFFRKPNIKVGILYPSGKVSLLQEKQLTTLGINITAFEIDGTFDDCQSLVKQSFMDADLNNKYYLTSANSINIARLLPQAIYYFYAWSRVENKDKPIVFSVPSGNLGNLTAGLIAEKIGLPVSLFISAVNSNTVFSNYINSGVFNPEPSKRTFSNAMDVGNPSNIFRIFRLFNEDITSIREKITAISINDEKTLETISNTYQKYGYLPDPHGAVGLAAYLEYRKETNKEDTGIILETAHPAKFYDIIEAETDIKVELPDALSKCMNGTKKSVVLDNSFEGFKNYLLNSKFDF